MTQQSGNRFDDDLTVGMEDNGSFSTDSIDLFEFSGGEESPIARLKTIILSIDWEINDDILQQLEEELVDLGDIWAGDKIKLIYIQGLSKIGKYIFKEKAKAHPNAINLLITFYHNLEKIVSSGDVMNEEEKKQLLLEDVRKFDQFKSEIGQSPTDSASTETPAALFTEETVNEGNEVEELKVLKGHVLGIDWEIDDQEIKKLSDEVQRLEVVFSQSQAKCILLQGIGALSSYINKMGSQSNRKSFTLLHSFYDVLEKISSAELSPSDEKQLLFAEIEKFKAFKGEIATAQTQYEPAEVKVDATSSIERDEPVSESKGDDVAMDSLPVEGDGEEEEVASDVAARLASVFGAVEDEDESTLDENAALEGVNVETEADDDSDEEALPFEGGAVAPALSEVEEESSFSVEKLAGDLAQFAQEDETEEDETEAESLLQGVDVETEADDDSDEEALPFEEGEIAPALSGSDDEGRFDEEGLVSDLEESDSDDLDNRLDSFFDDEVQSSSDEWSREGDDEAYDEVLDEDQELASALSDVVADDSEIFAEPVEEFLAPSEESLEFLDVAEDTSFDEEVSEEAALETVEDKLSFLDEDTPTREPEDVGAIEDVEQLIDDTADNQLSFLDEDIAATESIEAEEILQDEAEDTEYPFHEDAAPVPALSEETEELTAFEAEEEVEASTEDAISFLDEEPESPFIDEEPLETEDIVFDAEEEVADADEIAFSVPGEEIFETVATATITDEKEFGPDDEVIEFLVPGEDDSAEMESEEIVFEVVDDDVEVDLLPGEEYVESSTEFEEQGEVFSDKYVSLGSGITSLKESLTTETLQSVFAEINRLRNLTISDHTAKIYLQLLSTICQHLERNIADLDASVLSLMDEVFDGIKMNASSDAAPDQIQQHLLTCTSQVLLLQQKDIVNSQPALLEDQAELKDVVDTFGSDNAEIGDEQAVIEDSSESEDKLVSIVQDELADIKQIFVDEIRTIRKKFINK